MCSNKVFEVTESHIASELSPEEIYDILKNRKGWFAAFYDDEIRICFNRAETDVERLVRETIEAARRAEREEQQRQQIRNRELSSQRKAIFKKFKRSSPNYPEYVGFLKKISQGPLTQQDAARFTELKDMFNSDRSRSNFYRLMGWEQ